LSLSLLSLSIKPSFVSLKFLSFSIPFCLPLLCLHSRRFCLFCLSVYLFLSISFAFLSISCCLTLFCLFLCLCLALFLYV
jgi:hypothetical protein